MTHASLSRLAVPAIVVPLLALACSGPGAPTSGPARSSTVAVILNDEYFDGGGGSLNASPVTAQGGFVTFAISNKGSVPHEVKLVRTDEPVDSLSLDVFGEVEERNYEVVAVTFPSPVPAEREASVTKEVPPGRYVMICNIDGHYSSGMFQEFTTE